jgi:uncharacterized protein (TIGR02679 family)
VVSHVLGEVAPGDISPVVAGAEGAAAEGVAAPEGVAAEGAAVDVERLSRTLGDPALSRVVSRLARRLVLGTPLESELTLSEVTEAERLALGRILGRRVSLHGRSVRFSPSQLSAILVRSGIAPDLRSAVEALAGPVVSRTVIALAEGTARSAAVDVLAAGRHLGARWYDEWSQLLLLDGTVTRLVRAGWVDLIRLAVAVLDELPADTEPLPALAERVTGDTKALAGTRLARLVLRALALREVSAQSDGGSSALARAEVQRALWESAGVIPDDLASQVLVLGMAAVPCHPLGRWLSEAAVEGVPFRVTLQQLVSMPVSPVANTVFVCENPSVLRAAASAGVLAGRGVMADRESGSPVADHQGPVALVCTEGNASAACHRLLASVAGAGAAIRWRGDFAWTGLRAVTAAVARYSAAPWRMSAADYDLALAAGPTARVRGLPADSPWDPPLAARIAETGRAVMEERLIPLLIADLQAAVAAD